MNDPIENTKALLIDLINGDEKVTIREDYKVLDHKQEMTAYEQLIKDPHLSTASKKFLLENSWKIIYKQQPPRDINSFLSEEWVGPSAKDIHPWVRQDLINFMDPNKEYRNLYLAGCTGYGKSTEAAYLTAYILSSVAIMRNPRKVLPNISKITPIVAMMGSFTLDKATQLLLSPFRSILNTSPKFRNVKFSYRVKEATEEEDREGKKIVWTAASSMKGEIEFPHNTHVVLASDLSGLLGASILIGTLSELNFFLGKGVSAEVINQFKTDLEQRIFGRFGNNYWARMCIDSSANSFDSPIDRYVYSGEAIKNPKNMVATAKHWDLYSHTPLYKKYRETGETFPVYKGSGGKVPKILDKNEIKSYAVDDVINFPVDLKSFCEDNLGKMIKDYASFPANSDTKLITNYDIIEKAFTPQLLNEYDAITAPASKDPKQLIWDQIRDKYFIKVAENKWEFYRAPGELRWLTVDQAETKDAAAIGMVHPEIDVSSGEIVIVTDFLIPYIADKEPINVDAAAEFIFDLHRLGGINFGGISFDIHQSVGNWQRVERELEIKVQRSQCDLELAPYNVLVSKLKQHLIKCGKSIFLKNNLKSLQETTSKGGKKKKIDHTSGKIVNVAVAGCTWETDLRGIHAKDISDTLAQSTYQCLNEFQGIPKYTWVDKSTVGNCAVSKSELEQILKDKFGMEFRKL